ncbi:MAG: ABC transporter permease [Candidatus Dormibacteraceae bacterium]
MAKYTCRRIAEAIPLLFLVSLASFFIMHLAPGGPLAAYAHNPLVSPGQIAKLKAELGLDDPWYVQYLKWLSALLQGNWGLSYQDGRPVLAVISERLPATLLLMGAALLISVGLALPIGIFSALRRYSKLDYTFTLGSFFAWAMPTFWFGLMAQFVLAVHLGLFPVSGFRGIGGGGPWDILHHLILPSLVLGLTSIASWSRFLRSSLLEVLVQPFMMTSKAKGNSGSTTLFRHALPVALLPLITIMGLDIPALFTGAVITETIFSWPGMGQLFFASLNARDYPVEMGLLIITSSLIIGGNLVADLGYALLDPRIRLGAKA